MGALEIIERRGGWPEHSTCVGGCPQVGTGRRVIGTRSATHVAILAGYPAAGLCKRCAAEWPRMWTEALEGPAAEVLAA